jgi:dolichol-phosphate mannosyltransferase
VHALSIKGKVGFTNAYLFRPDTLELPKVENMPEERQSRLNAKTAKEASPAGTRPEPAPGVATQNAVVVVPTFNERTNIARLVDTLFGLYPNIHVLVVDDHSPDGTSEVVRGLQQDRDNLMLLERTHNPGFAASYRDGFRQALASPWCQVVITMDADFSHDPSEIRHLLGRLAGHDVVVGSRYIAGGSVQRWNLRRRLLSLTANLYVRAALSLPIHDTTSGFLCMRREALEGVPVQKTFSEGYVFLVELKCLLNRSGCKIVEHPIVFDERREGQSKMSIGKVWESFWMPWRIRATIRERRSPAEA